MAEWIIEVKDGKFPIGKWTELVRCWDCKHGTEVDYKDIYFCRLGNGTHHGTFYCANAGRKNEVEE